MQECSLCRKKLRYEETYMYHSSIPLCAECLIKVRSKRKEENVKNGQDR